ncbi:MAG: hypothetical protein KKC20_05540 [Proteobacteria bacterium]|nr:hypothetical protein [Pseudomonadota bacterium]
MLGFGKKKKDADETQEKGTIDAPAPSPSDKNAKTKDKKPKTKGKNEPEPIEIVEESPQPEKKKFITKKRVFILLMVLGAVGASSFLVYFLYFTEKAPEKAVFEERELIHVKLPREMLKFSFDHFPDLYIFLVTFNTEVNRFDREIERIERLGQKYPEQKKITDTEIKLLEKGKNTLIKEFSKLEKPIKETYVLFRVNETQGLASVKEKETELTDIARAALTAAQEQTQKIPPHTPEVPQGLFQGTLYKIKKKLL